MKRRSAVGPASRLEEARSSVLLDCRTPAVRRILMLTGARNHTLSDEALEAGADDYLIKPFEPEDLVQRVAAALQTKSFAVSRKVR